MERIGECREEHIGRPGFCHGSGANLVLDRIERRERGSATCRGSHIGASSYGTS